MPDKKQEKKIEKKYYTVEVECLIPAKVRYRVLIDEDKFTLAANETIKINPSGPPQLDLSRMKRIQAKVYDYGTTLIKHIHRF
jgi:hypothetical protein